MHLWCPSESCFQLYCLFFNRNIKLAISFEKMQDQHDDGEMGLNESRFLIEELNLDDQPTEEEVLERA